VECDERRERSDVHDPPVAPIEHVPAENLAAPQRAREVRLEHVVPRRIVQLERGRLHGLGRAVDQDVHFAERFENAARELHERGAIDDVAGNAQGLLAQRFDLGGHLLDAFHAPRRGHDIGARRGQPQRERSANPTRSTHDHRRAAVETERSVTFGDHGPRTQLHPTPARGSP
jgi:hypothetical protein